MKNSKIKKAFLMGIGLSALTKEKAEKISKQLLERGEADKGEIKEFASKMMKEFEKKQRRLNKLVQKEAQKIADKALTEADKGIRELRSLVTKPAKKTVKKKAIRKKSTKKKSVKKKTTKKRTAKRKR